MDSSPDELFAATSSQLIDPSRWQTPQDQTQMPKQLHTWPSDTRSLVARRVIYHLRLMKAKDIRIESRDAVPGDFR